jgi:hypothetical protein
LLCSAETHETNAAIQRFVPKKEPFQGARFTIAFTNNVVSAGSTNALKCTIQNSSTNKILAIGTLPSVSLIELTNSSGKCHVVSQDAVKEHQGGNTFAGISSAGSFRLDIEAGQTVEWGEIFFVPRNIDPGNYKLIARQFVCTSDGRYAFGLESNIVELKIIK